jgi:hypothetical protein
MALKGFSSFIQERQGNGANQLRKCSRILRNNHEDRQEAARDEFLSKRAYPARVRDQNVVMPMMEANRRSVRSFTGCG